MLVKHSWVRRGRMWSWVSVQRQHHQMQDLLGRGSDQSVMASIKHHSNFQKRSTKQLPLEEQVWVNKLLWGVSLHLHSTLLPMLHQPMLLTLSEQCADVNKQTSSTLVSHYKVTKPLNQAIVACELHNCNKLKFQCLWLRKCCCEINLYIVLRHTNITYISVQALCILLQGS